MRRIAKLGLVGAVVVAGLAGVAAVAVADDDGGKATAAADRKQAVEEFDELRDRQYQAWADKDGAAFAASFAEDADVVTFNGEILSTRGEIAEKMQYYFDNFIEDTTIELVDEKIRFVDARSAIVIRTTCLIRDGESECREGSDSVNTTVLAKRHGEWSQQSFQNTRVEPFD